MSGNAPAVDLVVKGAACQCLDLLPQHRIIMRNFQGALMGISGKKFAGLETVFGQHLLPLIFGPKTVARLVEHLRDHWFDPRSPTTFFPNTPVAEIYGKGLIQTLRTSLSAKSPLPIDAYWLVDHPRFEMLNVKSPNQVTLVIATPRPAGKALTSTRKLKATGAAWSTRIRDGKVETRKIEPPTF